MSALVDQPEGPVATERGYRIVRTGLIIERDLSKRQWEHLGEKLMSFESGLQWAIGDWIVYGAGRGHHGQTYEVAQRVTGRSFDSLSQYARVSISYHFEERDARCPWSIYRLALSLDYDHRMQALKEAAEKRWTQRDFLAFIRLRQRPASEPRDSMEIVREASAAPLEQAMREVSETVVHDQQSGRRLFGKTLGWRTPEKQAAKRTVTCPACSHRFQIRRQES